MNDMIGTRRESAKHQRRERIYAAALFLFREQGYEQTTIDQITKRAGVAKGTFFNYFESKEAIVKYLGAREIGRSGSAPASRVAQSSAVGKLNGMMAMLARSLQKDRELVCLLFRRGITVPELMAGKAGGLSVQTTIALLIRQAQRMGEVNRDLDPDKLATVLDGLYLQQLVQWCESDDSEDLERRLTGIVDLFFTGAAAH